MKGFAMPLLEDASHTPNQPNEYDISLMISEHREEKGG
jgi:hypothetical protein